MNITIKHVSGLLNALLFFTLITPHTLQCETPSAQTERTTKAHERCGEIPAPETFLKEWEMSFESREFFAYGGYYGSIKQCDESQQLDGKRCQVHRQDFAELIRSNILISEPDLLLRTARGTTLTGTVAVIGNGPGVASVLRDLILMAQERNGPDRIVLLGQDHTTGGFSPAFCSPLNRLALRARKFSDAGEWAADRIAELPDVDPCKARFAALKKLEGIKVSTGTKFEIADGEGSLRWKAAESGREREVLADWIVTVLGKQY